MQKARAAAKAPHEAEYDGYVAALVQGRASCIKTGPGVSVSVARARLATAARKANIEIVIRTAGNLLFYWTGRATSTRRW
jgi:TPP-dependent trihydroxycyclohexane-1,2-dione (THcHDO) dehydratase